MTVTIAPPVSPPVPAAPPRGRRRTTPFLLQAGLAIVALCCALYAWSEATAIADARQAAQTVGFDAAPSIIAALGARSDVAGADANVANALLSSGDQHVNAAQAVDDKLNSAYDRMIAAAENITYGKAERDPLETMEFGLQSYLEAWGEMRLLYQRNDYSGLITDYRYRTATALLHKQVFSAADQLAKVNRDHLTAAYQDQTSQENLAILQFLVVSMLVLFVLGALQVILVRRTRRVFNPMLLGASLLVVMFSLLTWMTLNREASDLKIAKLDAFDSIDALWQARAIAWDAYADESRYLLDTAGAADYETSFMTKAALLASGSNGSALTAPQIASIVQQDQRDKRSTAQFKGLLGAELGNITFTGEFDAASHALATYGQYLAIDDQVRALERAGNHQNAVVQAAGAQPGQLLGAFKQFDQALDDTIAINQKAFDDAIARSLGDARNYEYYAVVVALLITGLTWFGILPRLREYRS